MAGGFRDIEPIGKIGGADAPTSRKGSQGEGGEGPQRVAIRGEIVAIHRRNIHHDGESHVLDVSVGGEEHTEITVRVPSRAYGAIEGRRVVMYLLEP